MSSIGVGEELVQAPFGDLATVGRIEAFLKLLAKPLVVQFGGLRLLDDEVDLVRLVVLDANESPRLGGDGLSLFFRQFRRHTRIMAQRAAMWSYGPAEAGRSGTAPAGGVLQL